MSRTIHLIVALTLSQARSLLLESMNKIPSSNLYIAVTDLQ